MILLDTRVLTEMTRPMPDPQVDALPEGDVWISAVTVAQIRLGLELLPAGQFALIVEERNRQGHPISVEDAQIAAIGGTASRALAMCNIKDVIGIEGLKLVIPWADFLNE